MKATTIISGTGGQLLRLEITPSYFITVPYTEAIEPQIKELMASVNAFPALLRQLEETTNQLDLYSTAADRGSQTVIHESRQLIANLKLYLRP